LVFTGRGAEASYPYPHREDPISLFSPIDRDKFFVYLKFSTSCKIIAGYRIYYYKEIIESGSATFESRRNDG
jgi:hypothetical protein